MFIFHILYQRSKAKQRQRRIFYSLNQLCKRCAGSTFYIIFIIADNGDNGGQPLQRFKVSPPTSPPAHSAPTSTMVAGGLGSGVFLHFDKKLADCVKQYPCLYDSKTVGYKDKNTATKAWELVAKEVEVENGKLFYFFNSALLIQEEEATIRLW